MIIDAPPEAPAPATHSTARGLVVGMLSTFAGLAVAEVVTGLYRGASSPVLPVGQEVIDATGDGELAVAIRSGLLDDTTVTLYAGAGIVRDSDADAEWAETDVKLRALGGQVHGSQEPDIAGEFDRTATEIRR